MEICEICGKGTPLGWDRRVNVNEKNGENVYFCSDKCQDEWNKTEFGIKTSN